MRSSFTIAHALTLPLILMSPIFAAADEILVEADGRGYASFSNYALTEEMSFGRLLQVLTFEMSIVAPPPCDRVMIWFDLEAPSGAVIASGLMAGSQPIYIREGESYVTTIKRTGLDKAGRIRLWPECSAVR